MEKTIYACGSTDWDKFWHMRRIVLHYTHETPKYRTEQLKNGKIYYGLSVLLSKEEQDVIRREIGWIGVPASRKVIIR